MKGKVTWYSSLKGYGFIEGEDGKAYFVHQSNILKDGFRKLKGDRAVEFEPAEGEKGLSATKVQEVEA